MADLDPCLSVGTLCLQAVLYLRNIFKFTKINIYILKTSFDIEYSMDVNCPPKKCDIYHVLVVLLCYLSTFFHFQES